jgi:Tol biopolymer transport system component
VLPGVNRLSISEDGRYVAFPSDAYDLVPGDTNGKSDVFVRDRAMKTTELVSVTCGGVSGNSFSDAPSMSADGRWVAFWSTADDLVPEDSNHSIDVFVTERSVNAP